MTSIVVKGTLTIAPELGTVHCHDQNGECLLELVGLAIPDPKKIRVEVEQSLRRKLNQLDKDQILEMARRKIQVIEISRTLRIDGRKVSGIVANARIRGLLPPVGPKEWSPRNQGPKASKK